ncbi:hypothetical protein NDU88_006000 [Pleurodeles waltl]|uniref:Uncharacterized protein n=1 Tax=Pleurodeles waltl TaxID=8319 RepID=A0AAV7WDJ3_PLEWA|nr:hypothetical protein NDU88_006000 [Pleurodeles waltl]
MGLLDADLQSGPGSGGGLGLRRAAPGRCVQSGSMPGPVSGLGEMVGGEGQVGLHGGEIYVVVPDMHEGGGNLHFFDTLDEVWRWLELCGKVPRSGSTHGRSTKGDLSSAWSINRNALEKSDEVGHHLDDEPSCSRVEIQNDGTMAVVSSQPLWGMSHKRKILGWGEQYK